MPYDGQSWNESEPTNATLANEIDDVARDMKTGVRSRMALEHVFPASQTGTSEGGRHSVITFQAQTAVPSMPTVSSVTQAGMLFVTSGALTFQNSAGTTVTLVNSAGRNTVVGAIYSSTGSNGELIIGSSGGALNILAPASTSGRVLVSSATASPTWGTLSGFGAWEAKSAATTYQATADGIFIVTITAQGGQVITLQALSDSTASPVAVRASNIQAITGGAGQMFTVTIPVRKNDYYSSVASGGNGSTASFLPLGT